ncbi:BglG family transcription antiterminator [Streptococcus himalayensis]|uniref:Transcriptional regulator n=1 Tax=Streptococcus himalayensis TaxID=1888195 RepID=A0A917A4B0_9STRE|nr:PRD domain-containing protein [Streptococcus himalayensis]GGE25763.1 transcriptional regulator [Streptococcus himalayensis]
MLHQKEKHILQYLIDHKGEFVTSKALAEALSCSDRTVRTYLKSLMELDERETGFCLEAKQGYGYRLTICQSLLYQTFMQSESLSETGGNGDNIEDRYHYLVNKLLFEQAQLYFDDLAEELFVSRSTLSSDFKKIRKDLAAYDLTIESKANYGVYVVGSERNKRRFIMDHFFRDQSFASLHQYIPMEINEKQLNLEDLTLIVLEECREGELRLSDFVIQNLVTHLVLSVRRIAQGFQIKQIEDLAREDYPKERKIAESILIRVSRLISLDFPEEEIDYITLHLISKAYHQHSSILDGGESLRSQLIQVLEYHPSVKKYRFQQDFQLVEGVLTHLATLLIRLKNHVKLENPLLADIKKSYLPVFQLTADMLAAMPSFAHLTLSEDEIAYVALHVMAAMERIKEKQKFNILVICATGFGSAQLLKNRIELELGNLVTVVDVIGYYDLNDERMQGIDFIISSIDLSNLVFSLPVFTVSIFLTNDEVKLIKQRLRTMNPLEMVNRQNQQTETEKNLSQLFDDYFSEDWFMIGEQTSQEAILEELLRKMADGEDEGFVSRMKEGIRQREQLSSIVFSPEIAVPHPIKPLAKNHKIGLVLLPSGVRWNEQENVRFVFLPSPSMYENEGMTALTSKIVDLLEEPELQRRLLTCQNLAAFKKEFLEEGEIR